MRSIRVSNERVPEIEKRVYSGRVTPGVTGLIPKSGREEYMCIRRMKGPEKKVL